MIKLRIFAAIALLSVGACTATETTSRLDTGIMPFAISATRDVREPTQSLAIVAMKDSLAPGETLAVPDRARRVIASYGN